MGHIRRAAPLLSVSEFTVRHPLVDKRNQEQYTAGMQYRLVGPWSPGAGPDWEHWVLPGF